MFHIGQEVVCIDDEEREEYIPAIIRTLRAMFVEQGHLLGTLDGLTKNKVYTIRDIGYHMDIPCLWLNEIHRGDGVFGETGFHRARFKPLEKKETKTDISQFAPLLDTKVLEDA